MTLSEFAQVVERSGIPVAYKTFRAEQDPGLPKSTYKKTGEKVMYCDDKPFYKWEKVELVLYTKRKDTYTECMLESALLAADLKWIKDESDNAADSETYSVKYSLEV